MPRSEAISIGDADLILFAPLTDAAVTAYYAVQTAIQRPKHGTSAALIGIGGLGSCGIQFVKLLSAARTFALNAAPERLAMAKSLGAHEKRLSDDDSDGGAAA